MNVKLMRPRQSENLPRDSKGGHPPEKELIVRIYECKWALLRPKSGLSVRNRINETIHQICTYFFPGLHRPGGDGRCAKGQGSCCQIAPSSFFELRTKHAKGYMKIRINMGFGIRSTDQRMPKSLGLSKAELPSEGGFVLTAPVRGGALNPAVISASLALRLISEYSC
jgi:hypothetical protein